jgi:hypothetical protein
MIMRSFLPPVPQTLQQAKLGNMYEHNLYPKVMLQFHQ